MRACVFNHVGLCNPMDCSLPGSSDYLMIIPKVSSKQGSLNRDAQPPCGQAWGK